MISLAQYFGSKLHSPEQEAAAADLLAREEALVCEAEAAGQFTRNLDPDTGTEISGSKGGSGDGGFRLTTATTGSLGSSHKILPADKPAGAGVDRYDPSDRLDDWLDTFEDGKGGNAMLEKHGLYREAASATPQWTHITTRPPGSGRRTFLP